MSAGYVFRWEWYHAGSASTGSRLAPMGAPTKALTIVRGSSGRRFPPAFLPAEKIRFPLPGLP